MKKGKMKTGLLTLHIDFLPQLLDTHVKSVVLWSTNAWIDSSGIPHNPKPPTHLLTIHQNMNTENWIIRMKTNSVAPLGMSLVASCALIYSLLETKLNDLNYFKVTHEIWSILSEILTTWFIKSVLERRWRGNMISKGNN